jgi:competence protein ComEA
MKNGLLALAFSLLIGAGLTPASAAPPDRGAAASPLQLAQAATASGTRAVEKSSDKPADKATGKAPALIDINTATEEELATLPGIGEARAKAIVKGRPYARKDELPRRKIIPQSVYDNIKERIIAKQKP